MLLLGEGCGDLVGGWSAGLEVDGGEGGEEVGGLGSELVFYVEGDGQGV